MSGSNDRLQMFRDLGMLSALGIMFVVSTFMGLFMGIYLDGKLGTKPWLTLLFLLFGIIAAFLSLYREISKLVKRQKQMDGHGGSDDVETD